MESLSEFAVLVVVSLAVLTFWTWIVVDLAAYRASANAGKQIESLKEEWIRRIDRQWNEYHDFRGGVIKDYKESVAVVHEDVRRVRSELKTLQLNVESNEGLIIAVNKLVNELKAAAEEEESPESKVSVAQQTIEEMLPVFWKEIIEEQEKKKEAK